MSLLFIASRLGDNEINDLKQIFTAFDTDKDGQISMKELNGFLETWFDFITLRVTSKGVVVDKPRFVPIKEK